MKRWFFLLFLFPLASVAQTYKYIGVEDGLSNRRVYSIQKDLKGYMWFLTHEGIDRYNGKDFKQYKLMDGNKDLNSLLDLNWLYLDKEGVLWEIGKKGKIFRYDSLHDVFTLVFKLPEQNIKNIPAPISYSFIDKNNQIWLCADTVIYLYNTQLQETIQIRNKIGESITNIEQVDPTHFFIGTEIGIHYAEIKDNALRIVPCNKLDSISIQINELYFEPQSRKLFIGTFQKGILVYDMNLKQVLQPKVGLTDISITRFKPFNKKELLIATDGAGVYKLNIDTYQSVPYITADYNSNNAMNGNSIADVYVDDEQRIWMANYPVGITVRNNRYSSYNWIKHSIGNKQSLVNNQVNAIIEDQDGDLWFGTNNGISLYKSQTKEWHSFYSFFNKEQRDKNHVFITLCEVEPGVIWAGGYSSGIYQINKKDLSVGYFTPALFNQPNIRPDKYIREITKDSDGDIWSGGYYNLKRTNLKEKKVRLYEGLNSVSAIEERNRDYMWIGSATGLYLLEKKTGRFQLIKLPVESTYIYSLYQAPNDLLYIGTGGSGLLIYDMAHQSFQHHHMGNSALLSNNIYTILSDNDTNIFVSTENGLTKFSTLTKTFQNWTRDQGLASIHFNASSGILRKNNRLIFGSSDGAIEFEKEMTIPTTYPSTMVFSDFRLFYQTVYPGEKDSPLVTDINQTQQLRLKYNQNIFSLDVSSINYDYPSNILYSSKLEGFYDEWSRPSDENTIRFTNLSPGEYTLRIRAISAEDPRIVLEERSMKLLIDYPFWLSLGALLIYILIIAVVAVVVIRIIILRKQRKISDEKIQFFVNTAHDIRTPLTLIKAPLEEIDKQEQFSQNGISNMNTAMRNVNALLRLTNNLINFEKAEVYSAGLFITEYELNAFMKDAFEAFRTYADIKQIHFTYETNFHYLNVWFDKEKMESILKNILSNALKYTPENGSVHFFVYEKKDTWNIELKDTGIGIPANEQKKLFKMHFRGSNAINSKETGSGIGLVLVAKLVELHRGKITLNSIEKQGSVVKIAFPKDSKKYRKAHLATKGKLPNSNDINALSNIDSITPISYQTPKNQNNENKQRILVVEDNDDLRNYLSHTLSDQYKVQTSSNGKEALTIIKEYNPELIISDIMMPEMGGDKLCTLLKNDIETSHIPIILLTALNEEQNILDGLRIGADEYVVKPFNIGILKATVTNLLTNRALLRNKYGNPEVALVEENQCINCSTDLDWKFIATVRKSVEDNLDNQAFNVDVLCNLMSMSRTSFYNKIKVLTDQAPGDYIRVIRLTRAAKLLKEGKHNITEIAELTGFNDAKYFREVFKKHFKVSPSKYSKGVME